MSEEGVVVRKYKKPNRRRKNRVIIELSDGERESLQELVQRSGLDTISAYLRYLIRHTAATQVLD